MDTRVGDGRTRIVTGEVVSNCLRMRKGWWNLVWPQLRGGSKSVPHFLETEMPQKHSGKKIQIMCVLSRKGGDPETYRAK